MNKFINFTCNYFYIKRPLNLGKDITNNSIFFKGKENF